MMSITAHVRYMVFSCKKATLYQGVSVRPWVPESVGPLVMLGLLGATYAVYPALFSILKKISSCFSIADNVKDHDELQISLRLFLIL